MSEHLAPVTHPSEGVAQITLNRPDAMNTMTPQLLDDTLESLRVVADDPDVRVVVFTGAGKAFCAGGDLKRGPGGSVTGSGSLAEQTAELRRFMSTSQLLREMPKVTIAAVNGACAGAGLAWACAADIRIMSEKARMATAFRNAGLSGDFGGTWLLPRIVGTGIARDLYLRSGPISAERALSIGLVSEVVEAEQVLARSIAIAEEIVASSPLAVPMIKANLNDADRTSFAEALDLEAQRHAALTISEDAAEAARAFAEKRTPRWAGR